MQARVSKAYFIPPLNRENVKKPILTDIELQNAEDFRIMQLEFYNYIKLEKI